MIAPLLDDELVVDTFAGAGGASTALEAALGCPVDLAFNHNETALAAHARNHPETVHLREDLRKVSPRKATKGRPVGVLWASPDCRHFSKAKGGKPVDRKIRGLATVVVRWAREVRPRVIFLENVEEFRGWGPLIRVCTCPVPDTRKAKHPKPCMYGRPIEARRGEFFRRFVRRLERYGYKVDHRLLDASHYGAPTRRRRLFLVARCDGEPIRWPSPTHGGLGLKPLRTAAEIIDWDLPCPSIFEPGRDLVAKTLWRIAAGIKKFVLDNPRPFILKVNHGRMEDRSESIDAPLSTVTAARRGHALVAPVLIQKGYGERKGQAARVLDINQPLGTVVAGGIKHNLVAAFLSKHYGDPNRKSGGGRVLGQQLDLPVGTITTRDHHSLTAATLVKFRGTSGQNPTASLEEPLPTVTAGGNHLAEVRAFLAVYYGKDAGQPLDSPLRTIPTRDRFGLVTVEGTDYVITDIGMRMLEPHELLAAQFGKYAAGYDLSVAESKAAKVRLIGNSVAPECAEALIRANVAPRRARRAAA